MKILIIETSAAECSVAVAENGKTILERTTSNQVQSEGVATARSQHSTLLATFIEELLSQCGGRVDAVAVSYGPGSYTGLRIGLSTAKGICFAMGVPLILVDSLQGLVERAVRELGGRVSKNELLCPMIDARRMEVYTALYSTEGERLEDIYPLVVSAESFEEARNSGKELILFGSGAKKCLEVLANSGLRVRYLDSAVCAEASDFSGVVCRMYEAEEFADLAYCEPLYLKEWQSTTAKPQKVC